MNAKLSKSLSLHNLAASFSSGTSESSSPTATPSNGRSRSPSQSSLKLNLSAALSVEAMAFDKTLDKVQRTKSNSVTSLK